MTNNPFRFSGVCLFILFIALRTMNQIFFKQLALGPGGSRYIALFSDPLFYLTIIIFLAQVATWLVVLNHLPLTYAYPLTSLTVITLLISGVVFFGESITIGNVLGALVIMAGVAVIGGGQA